MLLTAYGKGDSCHSRDSCYVRLDLGRQKPEHPLPCRLEKGHDVRTWQGTVGSLQRLEQPLATASRRMGISVFLPQETNSALNRRESGGEPFPRGSWLGHNSSQHTG